MESLINQILKRGVTPIVIEKELEVEYCVRGHHVYESNWDAKTGSKLKPCHEKRPNALLENKYAMTLKFNDTTVGHVPKFLSKITYFFLKLGGDLVVKIKGQGDIHETWVKGEWSSLVRMYLHQPMQKCTQNLKCLLKKPWNNTTIK